MILYTIACIGFTFIIKYGSILNWLRSGLSRYKLFKELFSCSLCIGFWTGTYIGVMYYLISPDVKLFLLPLVSAVCSWCADAIIGILQSTEILLDKKISILNERDDEL